MKGELNKKKIYRYCIQVEGELDRSWSEWLDGFAVRTQEDGLTLLVGEVVDQSALHGLLGRLHRLGLTLQLVVLVNCFPSAAQVDNKSRRKWAGHKVRKSELAASYSANFSLEKIRHSFIKEER